MRWEKLKARTEGALLDWTRQHAPPWDLVYLGCAWAHGMELNNSDEACAACPAGPWMTRRFSQ